MSDFATEAYRHCLHGEATAQHQRSAASQIALLNSDVARFREALTEATEAIGVCIAGFEKSNPTLGGMAAIHMLTEARDRYRALLSKSGVPSHV